MDKKEEELLSMHYQMEKTDIKQQRLEDRLMFISEDLKRSKNIRNFYFIFIIILMLLLTIGSFYVVFNNESTSTDTISSETPKDVNLLLLENDSLQKEILKLKTNISEYKNEESFNKVDSADGMINEGVIGDIENRGLNNMKLEKDTVGTKPKLKFERRHCYVNKVYKSNDVVFIEVDIIEYYQGKKAVKKAKEYGKAEYDMDKNGDTLYFLYNNYYIHNQSSRSKILELDDKARVKVDNINQISYGFPMKAFQKVILDKPILILEISNGVVYRITEQKLP